MLGTIFWLMLLALCLLIELLSRLGRTATPSLIRTGAFVAGSVVGRLFLLAFWISLVSTFLPVTRCRDTNSRVAHRVVPTRILMFEV